MRRRFALALVTGLTAALAAAGCSTSSAPSTPDAHRDLPPVSVVNFDPPAVHQDTPRQALMRSIEEIHYGLWMDGFVPISEQFDDSGKMKWAETIWLNGPVQIIVRSGYVEGMGVIGMSFLRTSPEGEPIWMYCGPSTGANAGGYGHKEILASFQSLDFNELRKAGCDGVHDTKRN